MAAGVAGSVASAQTLSQGVGLTFDMSASLLAAVQQPEGQPAAAAKPEKAAAPESVRPDFGALTPKGGERQWYVTVGAGVATDGDPGTHYDGFVAFSTFIGKDLEVQIEGNGWYFDQDQGSTGGVGFAFDLRWHFLHGAYGGGDGHDWTVYADAGIGLIFSGDDVPPDGSSVNLAPRAGMGFTARLGESSTRLVGGIRWHHMSNARFNGDSNNPDFNAPMFYLGVQWPLGG